MAQWRGCRSLAAAALVTFVMLIAPAGAEAAPDTRWGVEVGTQALMFLPGIEGSFIYERELSPLLTLAATAGFAWSAAPSLLHTHWDLFATTAAAVYLRPLLTGLEFDLQLRLIEVRDGSPLAASIATSLRGGPAVVSRLPLGRRFGLAVRPKAGALWTLTQGRFARLPTWYLGLALSLLF